jgi:hypothetical protein
MLLTACAIQVNKSDFRKEPATIAPGDPIPAPIERVILTISGDISVTNIGDELQFDLPTLERLGLAEYTIEDPYRFEEVTYTGVLMEDFRDYLGVSEASEKFHIVALDDYEVDLSFADIERWPILLATRSDGEYMTVENSGPIRIIFPYGLYDIDPVRYNDLWIWNIESMQVN